MDHLPNEIVENILRYCSYRDRLNLSRVDDKLKTLVSSPRLWRDVIIIFQNDQQFLSVGRTSTSPVGNLEEFFQTFGKEAVSLDVRLDRLGTGNMGRLREVENVLRRLKTGKVRNFVLTFSQSWPRCRIQKLLEDNKTSLHHATINFEGSCMPAMRCLRELCKMSPPKLETLSLFSRTSPSQSKDLAKTLRNSIYTHYVMGYDVSSCLNQCPSLKKLETNNKILSVNLTSTSSGEQWNNVYILDEDSFMG